MAERTQCARPGQRRHLLEAAPRGQSPVGVRPRWGSVPGGGQSPSQLCTPRVWGKPGVRPRWGSVAVTNVHAPCGHVFRRLRCPIVACLGSDPGGGQSPSQMCTPRVWENLGSDPGGGQSPSQMCTPLAGPVYCRGSDVHIPAWNAIDVAAGPRARRAASPLRARPAR
jgi:hypothetical protein